MCTRVYVPEEASKGVSSPGVGVAGSCKMPSKSFGTPTVVKEQQVLFTAELRC